MAAVAINSFFHDLPRYDKPCSRPNVRMLKYYIKLLPLQLDQAEKGGMVPPEGKFMKLGGTVNFGVLSSKIDVIQATKGDISLVLTNKSSFSC